MQFIPFNNFAKLQRCVMLQSADVDFYKFCSLGQSNLSWSLIWLGPKLYLTKVLSHKHSCSFSISSFVLELVFPYFNHRYISTDRTCFIFFFFFLFCSALQFKYRAVFCHIENDSEDRRRTAWRVCPFTFVNRYSYGIEFPTWDKVGFLLNWST